MTTHYIVCRRSLHTQHQAKVEEAVEQAKALQKAMKAGHVAAQVIYLSLTKIILEYCAYIFTDAPKFTSLHLCSFAPFGH